VLSCIYYATKAAQQNTKKHTWFTQYRTSDVAENVGSTFIVRGVQPMEIYIHLYYTEKAAITIGKKIAEKA